VEKKTVEDAHNECRPLRRRSHLPRLAPQSALSQGHHNSLD
jgi:hypothetical protein